MKDKRATVVEALRVVGLVVLSVLIWCGVMNRWSVVAWRTPLAYTEARAKFDVLSVYAAVKAAAAGHFMPLVSKEVPELGAPFVAQWNDFPITEEALFFLTGLLAQVVGLFAAVNLACLLAHVLAAVSFYAAGRLLKAAPVWCFAGALVFAFARYGFAHEAHHIVITYFWHVPLMLVVCRWLALDEDLAPGGWRWWFALAVGVVTGLQNVYYTNIFLQLVVLAVAVRMVRGGYRPGVMLPGLSVGAVTVGAFLLMNVDTLLFQQRHGPNPLAVVRHYASVEYYGLKVVDLFMPFPLHRWQPFAAWAESYFAQTSLRGEVPPPAYLGLVGIAGLVWLGVVTFRRLARPHTGAIPLEAGQTGWILLYATVGGLNAVVASVGMALFRSTTRYSIVILALVLLFLVRRLSALTAGLAFWRVLGPVVIVGVALWDQLPPMTTAAEIEKVAYQVASDRVFTQQMEARLPVGAMVFQLPVMEFPESSVHGVMAYDHFRPYLYAERLRFAYGSVRGRPSERWFLELDNCDWPAVVARLEQYGFGAVYVNRNGFENRGADIVARFRQMGGTEMIESPKGDLVCVFLRPSVHPALPAIP